jgi:hypothetical protein
MDETTVYPRDFAPGLPRLLAFAEAEQLEERLRNRVELARLRKETDNDLAELRDAEVWLADHSQQAAPEDLDPAWLAMAVEQAEEKEREAAAHFRPVVAVLESVLEPPNDKFAADVQKLLRDGIEVLEGWLAFYHGFRTMLARQAVERRGSAKVLLARPVAGEIDYEKLTRQIVGRFPKILAALAK